VALGVSIARVFGLERNRSAVNDDWISPVAAIFSARWVAIGSPPRRRRGAEAVGRGVRRRASGSLHAPASVGGNDALAAPVHAEQQACDSVAALLLSLTQASGY
jgi:hypothetical protein